MIAHKTIFSITALATALIFGGGVMLYMNLGDVAKVLAEKKASEVLGVKVTIGKMEIDVPNQRLAIRNLVIANPQGFDAPHALKVGQINMQGISLSKELLALGSIETKDTDIVFEVNPNGTNLQAISDNVKNAGNKKAAPANDNAETGEEGGAQKAPQQSVKVAIEKLAITQTTLTPAGLLGEAKLDPFTLDQITLNKIGTRSNPVLAREAIAQIWGEVSRKAISAAQRQGLVNKIGQELGVENLDGAVNDAVNKGAEKLRGLFE